MSKKLNVFTILATLLIFAACSGANKEETDSATVETDPLEMPAEDTPEVAVITDRGISPIKIGMAITDIRPAVENLYDTIRVEDGYDSTVYHFIRDGETRFDGYEFGDGTLAVIAAADDSVVADTPGGQLSLGMPFSEVLSLKGVSSSFQSLDGSGLWCWSWQGLYFQPSQDNLPQKLSSKLYNPSQAPAASDFDDSVTIDYIGTGLPF